MDAKKFSREKSVKNRGLLKNDGVATLTYDWCVSNDLKDSIAFKPYHVNDILCKIIGTKWNHYSDDDKVPLLRPH